MQAWLYRWLPIIFGCHCRSDRSFFYRGKQFPICARCTGELIGILCALPCFVLFSVPSWKTCLFLMLPLLLDGCAQKLTSYQSGNLRRLVTGVLFGYALVGLVSITTIFAAQAGFEFGKKSKIKTSHSGRFYFYNVINAVSFLARTRCPFR